MNFNEKIKIFLDTLDAIPKLDESVKKLDCFTNKLVYTQFLNTEEYISFYKKLDSEDIISIFEFFNYFFKDRLYYHFYNHLKKLKKQQKQFKKEIEAVQQFVKSLYFKFYTLDCFEHDESIWKFFAKQKDYTLVDVSNFYKANGLPKFAITGQPRYEIERKDYLPKTHSKIHNFLFSNEVLDIELCKTISSHLNYVVYMAYNITRKIVYDNLDSGFYFKYLLNKLENIKSTLFKRISDLNPLSLSRMFSFLACYHNIYIKYKLDNEGRKNIKPYVENYQEDLIFVNKYILTFTRITVNVKFLEAILDVAIYYNFINEKIHDELYYLYDNAIKVLIDKLFLTQSLKGYRKYNVLPASLEINNEIILNTLISDAFNISNVFDRRSKYPHTYLTHLEGYLNSLIKFFDAKDFFNLPYSFFPFS